jgi:phage host-nuclease inhibitor protein Gam
MKAIEDKCIQLTATRDALSVEVDALNTDIEAIKAKHRSKIRQLVRRLKSQRQALINDVVKNPDWFVKPKSQIFSGVKVGYKKQRGTITVADQDNSIKLLRRHLGDDAEALIQTSEKLIKDAVANQPASVLKKSGIAVTDDVDVCFVSFTDREIDKVINALLADDDMDGGAS